MKLTADTLDVLRFDPSTGLLPAVAQDAASGEIRMLGWMNRDAARETLARQRVVFWSRQRQCLWEKGETSGHSLELLSMHTDCDHDAVLLQVRPNGPTCHTGDRSCFGDTPPHDSGLAFLGELDRLIAQRAESIGKDASPDSYTVRLFESGVARIAQKVGEEGVEVALAATGADDHAVINEAADLIFHLLVLLRSRGHGIAEIARELERRHSKAEG